MASSIEHEQWEPEKIHYEYYSGEPEDEDLNQKGRGLFSHFVNKEKNDEFSKKNMKNDPIFSKSSF